MWTYEPRQGRKAATVVCSASAVVTLAFYNSFTGLGLNRNNGCHRFDARFQFLCGEGFGEGAIGAQLFGELDGLAEDEMLLACHDQHFEPGMIAPKLEQHLEAVLLGQENIQNNEVRGPRFQDVKAGGAIARAADFEAEVHEQFLQVFAHRFIIFDYENSFHTRRVASIPRARH